VRIESRQQKLILITILAFGLFTADRLVIEPLAGIWKDRAVRLKSLRKQVEEGAFLLQREQSLRARWEQMRTNSLPGNTSMAEQQLLKAFDAWAQESRVTITGITPQWKHDSDDYVTWDCHVDATGDLAALMHLLYSVEKNPMALKLEAVDLTSRDNTGREMTMGMRINGLVLTPGGQEQ